MQIKIIRTDDTFCSQDLKDYFEKMPGWDTSVTLKIEQPQVKATRTIDPTVLVAIIGIVGTSLGALIAGLLQILQEKHRERIVLVTKSGLRIEVEARNAMDKVPELIKLVQSMDVEIIRI
jgi:hypothetical protein